MCYSPQRLGPFVLAASEDTRNEARTVPLPVLHARLTAVAYILS